MEQNETEIKDLNLNEFERFILALVKYYPKGKKQKELAEEAGIDPSLISKWKKGERGRDKEKEFYKEFFTEYIDTKEYVISKTLKLKIVPDLFDKLIEIARKDNRAKEIIGKSKYLEELVSKDLELLIKAFSNKVIDINKACNYFINIIKSKGVNMKRLSNELGLSENVFSIFIKIFLIKFTLDLEQSKNLTETEIELAKYLVKANNLLDGQILLDVLKIYFKILGEIIISPWFQSILMNHGLTKDEIENFEKFVLKKRDFESFYLYDYKESKLLTELKKFGTFRKWLFVGCLAICVEFQTDINKLIEKIGVLTESERSLPIDVFDARIIKVKKTKQENLCPLEGFCDYNLSNLRAIANCKKFKDLITLQKNGRWIL